MVKGAGVMATQTRTAKGTQASGKVRRGKVTQAIARYTATYNRLMAQGKPTQAFNLAVPTQHKSLPHKQAPTPPIKTKGLKWCVLQYTVQVWGVGTARYTTQQATLRGYVLTQNNSVAVCYIPRKGNTPPHTVNASLTFTGLLPYHIIKMQT